MVIHAETRKKDLVYKLYSLGLSISYERVMHISTAICERFQNDDVVCPAKLRGDVFTTAAVDNIDHKPSSTTSKGSLYGTAISLFQHPAADNLGTEREVICISENVKRDNIKPLPERYSVVPPVILPKEPAAVPAMDGPLISDSTYFSDAHELAYRYFIVKLSIRIIAIYYSTHYGKMLLHISSYLCITTVNVYLIILLIYRWLNHVRRDCCHENDW